MFNWVRIFCGFPHSARSLMQIRSICFFLLLNVLSHYAYSRLVRKFTCLFCPGHNWLKRLKVVSCFDVFLFGQALLPSLREWWEQWVRWFTGKISEGRFRWSRGSAKSEVTKRSWWRTTFQKGNIGWIHLFLFHPRGNCPSKCIASNISGCLDYLLAHIYLTVSSE